MLKVVFELYYILNPQVVPEYSVIDKALPSPHHDKHPLPKA
jgi:hypothetical protein